MRSDTGKGSQIATSQTSRFGSGCALDWADSVPRIVERNRRGEEETGEESTRTRFAEGVLGTVSMEFSKSR